MRIKGNHVCEVSEASLYPQFLAPALAHRKPYSMVKEWLRELKMVVVVVNCKVCIPIIHYSSERIQTIKG